MIADSGIFQKKRKIWGGDEVSGIQSFFPCQSPLSLGDFIFINRISVKFSFNPPSLPFQLPAELKGAQEQRAATLFWTNKSSASHMEAIKNILTYPAGSVTFSFPPPPPPFLLKHREGRNLATLTRGFHQVSLPQAQPHTTAPTENSLRFLLSLKE